MARFRGWSLAEMALAWVLRDDAVTSVIVGVSSLGQLESNIRAAHHPGFSPDELEEIERVMES